MRSFSLERTARSSSIALLSLLCLAAQPLEEGQDVQIDFRKEYYDVAGATWPEVWRSVRRSGVTIDNTTLDFEGVTIFRLSLIPARGCTSSTSKVEMDLVVKVPGLPRGARLSEKDQQCWAHYERWLADHEEWHVQIAVHGANELIAEVRSSKNASCGDLQRLARAHFAEVKATQSAYDAVTQHGLEQWKAYELSEDPDPERRDLGAKCASRLL
jgi:predicted secreted Zn-dependent protease